MGCSSTKVVAHEPQQKKDFFDTYELAEVLGKGAYGTVHRAHGVEAKGELAVKILDLNSGKHSPAQLRKDARSEEKTWSRIGEHPNVVGLRQCFIDKSFAYFVMEFCTGSLVAAWEAEPNLNEYTYGRYFKEMAQALAHIHSVGVVHRDVKQDNFVVGAPDGRTVKLCDFGLSAVMVGDSPLTGDFGTPPYMAPEMVHECGTHGPPADVWSFGVIVYTLFFGCWPYKPSQPTAVEIARAIREGRDPPHFKASRGLPNVVSKVGIRFVQALLNRNQRARPSASSCATMAYLDQRIGINGQPIERNASHITLVPQFKAAIRIGAFNSLRLRRKPCFPNRNDARRSQAASPDAVGMDQVPSQLGLFDIQDHDWPIPTEEVLHITVEDQHQKRRDHKHKWPLLLNNQYERLLYQCSSAEVAHVP